MGTGNGNRPGTLSIQVEIERIATASATIRAKLIELGLSTQATDSAEAQAITETSLIDACASAVDGITNCGAVSATVKPGEVYTIPKGYHDGTGTVTGAAADA